MREAPQCDTGFPACEPPQSLAGKPVPHFALASFLPWPRPLAVGMARRAVRLVGLGAADATENIGAPRRCAPANETLVSRSYPAGMETVRRFNVSTAGSRSRFSPRKTTVRPFQFLTSVLIGFLSVIALLLAFSSSALATGDGHFDFRSALVMPTSESDGNVSYPLSLSDQTPIPTDCKFTELYIRMEFPPGYTPQASDIAQVRYGSTVVLDPSEFEIKIAGSVLEMWHPFPSDVSTNGGTFFTERYKTG
jgi:hypothetical protein